MFATATPVTNSISDIFAMQKYLQEGSLRAMGISSFDSWAAMFADKVTDYEIDVDTNSYRLTTRFSRFCNLPELLEGLFHFRSPSEIDRCQKPIWEGYSFLQLFF